MNFSSAVFEKSVGANIEDQERNLPEICFCGRSNVGKSSLINKVLNRKSIARVSATPGKTVTVNFYLADNVRLVDLPGYGYAKMTDKQRENFSVVAEGYFKKSENIKLCFCLADMRHPLSEYDINMLKYLKFYGIKYALVLTKCDKLNKTEFNSRLESIKEELGEYGKNIQIVPFSSLKNIGVEEIRTIIEKSV